jgi:hypothetical protein
MNQAMTKLRPCSRRLLIAVAATILAAMLPGVPAAHEAPDTPGGSGPVPEILMRHAPVMIYENGTLIPFVVDEDGSLFWFEMLPEIEKSFAGPARWTWDEREFCMIIDDHPTVCMALEAELTAGKAYDSTVRYLHEGTGEEVGSRPFRFLLIRTE